MGSVMLLLEHEWWEFCSKQAASDLTFHHGQYAFSACIDRWGIFKHLEHEKHEAMCIVECLALYHEQCCSRGLDIPVGM